MPPNATTSGVLSGSSAVLLLSLMRHELAEVVMTTCCGKDLETISRLLSPRGVRLRHGCLADDKAWRSPTADSLSGLEFAPSEGAMPGASCQRTLAKEQRRFDCSSFTPSLHRVARLTVYAKGSHWSWAGAVRSLDRWRPNGTMCMPALRGLKKGGADMAYVTCHESPNLGREAHTIAHHIRRRFHTLAPLTFFLQDDVLTQVRRGTAR